MFSSCPGGAPATTAPPGYAYESVNYKYVMMMMKTVMILGVVGSWWWLW